MKISWKAIGRFLKRWTPVVVEAIITKKMTDKMKQKSGVEEDVR